MTAETDLNTMLKTLGPELSPIDYVYCRVEKSIGDRLAAECLGTFREKAGMTLILPRETAEKNGLDFDFKFRKISLEVHSSLAAVGLLAEITGVLASEGIPVNVISGHDHDHLFVLEEDARLALEALEELSERARSR